MATESKKAETESKKAEETDETYKVYLITMDQMDQHWVNLDKGCQEAVKELGNVEYTWLAPDVKDDAKQIECINNAIAGGANAIILAANAIQEVGDSEVLGVGFDKSDTLLQLVKDGYLVASMAQNPDVMGYEGLKAAVEVLQGKDLAGKVIDTGVSVITADNVDDFK